MTTAVRNFTSRALTSVARELGAGETPAIRLEEAGVSVHTPEGRLYVSVEYGDVPFLHRKDGPGVAIGDLSPYDGEALLERLRAV